MSPAALLGASRLKGIAVLGTGDALHPGWRSAWEGFFENDAGITVVPTAEVEGARRVHHLILLEDFEACEELAGLLAPFSRTIHTAGRPHVALDGEALARLVHGVGGLIGPAHAFTPWTGMYAAYDRIEDCYGSEPVDFLELGLSADSSYGAAIPELAQIPFLSNSDAHSPLPHTLGREFTRLRAGVQSSRGVLAAVRGGKVAMNAGLFPEEGKYHLTACIRCFRTYSPAAAERAGWRCPADGGRIKKGVRDRARELAGGGTGPRPPYLRTLPLGEIIRFCLGTASPRTKGCMALYHRLIDELGSEIGILADLPPDEIREVDRQVGDAVAALRAGEVVLHPGGGGRYGTFELGKRG